MLAKSRRTQFDLHVPVMLDFPSGITIFVVASSQ
jgi:hypothetical protein